MQCPQCQTIVNEPARFCPICGSALSSVTPPASGTPDQPASTAGATPELPATQPINATRAADATLPLQHAPTAPGSLPRRPEVQASESSTSRRPPWGIIVGLLGALALMLLLALGIGATYATAQIRQRNTTISQLQGQVRDLTNANLGLQDQVKNVSAERDRITQERNNLAGEAAALRSSNAELQTKVNNLQQTLSDRERQLQQAQQEASRQQSRATTAEQVGTILARIVALDDEIHKEFGNLVDAFIAMQDAYDYRSAVAYQQAAQRADASIQRLRELFAQRDALLNQLQG